MTDLVLASEPSLCREMLSLLCGELCGTGDSRYHTVCEHVRWARSALVRVPTKRSWRSLPGQKPAVLSGTEGGWGADVPGWCRCLAEPLVGPGAAFRIRPQQHSYRAHLWDQASPRLPYGLGLAPSTSSGCSFGACQRRGLVLEGSPRKDTASQAPSGEVW